MNIKKFLLSTVGVFIFIFGFEYVVHGVLLHDIYASTASMWRPMDEMKMPFMLLSQIGFATFAVLLFICFNKLEIKKCKFMTGSIFGLVLLSEQIGTYSYLQIPLCLTLAWCLASFVKGFVSWAIAAVIYKD